MNLDVFMNVYDEVYEVELIVEDCECRVDWVNDLFWGNGGYIIDLTEGNEVAAESELLHQISWVDSLLHSLTDLTDKGEVSCESDLAERDDIDHLSRPSAGSGELSQSSDDVRLSRSSAGPGELSQSDDEIWVVSEEVLSEDELSRFWASASHLWRLVLSGISTASDYRQKFWDV